MLLFIIAVGLSITMGLMGFINLAHGAFAMAGGYAMASPTQAFGVPFLPALALAFLLVGGASILFERLLYARLYRASELDQVLFSIGLVFMAVAAFTFFYGPSPQRVVVPDFLGQIDLGARLSELSGVPDRRRPRPDGGALAAVRAHADRRAHPRRGRQPAHGAVGRHRRRGAVHLDLRLRQRSRRGRRRPGRGHHRALADVRDPVPRLFSDRGHGRWCRQPVAFVAALLLGFLDNAGKYLWPDGGAFFIYIATVALLLRKPDGLFGRAHRP